jgi:endoglycosylceramidase
LLDAAWQRRIWTIVDFHQDIYAENYCGDGFPAWTIPDPKPAPHHDCSDWFVRYSKDGDVRSAFDKLWADQDGTLEAFRSLWDRMAARHAGRPGVIGFEPINEPHPGNADANVWAKQTLTPFYTAMAARIHQKAPDALVFFDATGTDAIGSATAMDEPEGEGLVFAPHWYDPAALFGGVPAPSNAAAGITKWAELGTAWDRPVLVGESGAPRTLENASEFVTALEDAMDETGVHFTYWEYSDAKEEWNAEHLSFVDPDGNEAEPIVSALARVYPRAVAGESPSFRYDAASRVFTLSYDAPTPDGVTELVLPERSALAGGAVELSSGCYDDSHPGLLLVRAGERASSVEIVVRAR